MEADWSCAPFSTPLVWNFALQDSGSEASNLSTTQEADEFRPPRGESISQAYVFYADAEKKFQQAGANRGLAEVQLRYGYLAMLARNYSRAREQAQRATELFEDVGDTRQARLAKLHSLLARIGLGELTQIEERAGELGSEGASYSSFSYTLGLGILLNRFGRHWLIREGDYERALASYRAARALFLALGAQSNATQTLVDQGRVYQAIGDRPTAIAIYEDALDSYDQFAHSQPSMVDNRRQRILMLTTNLYQVYLQGTEADGMERSATRLKEQLSALPGGGMETGELLQAMAKGVADAVETESGALDKMFALGPDFWALRNLAESTIEQASILVPLYRARRAKERAAQPQATQMFAVAEKALPGVSEAQRPLLEISVLSEQGKLEAAADVVRRHILAGGADAGFTGTLTDLMQRFGGTHGQHEAQIQKRRTHEQAFTMFVRVKAYDEAKTQLDQLEALSGTEWWREDQRPWQPLSDCAEMYEGLGQIDTAMQYYERSITELERRRGQLSRDELKTALSADRGVQYLYFQAARAAMRKKDYAYAFVLAERGKARGLLDLMAGSTNGMGIPAAEDATLREWRQLSAQLTLRRGLIAQERLEPQPNRELVEQLTRQLHSDELRMRQIEGELARLLPNFGQVVSTEAPVLSAQQVAEALPEDTVLVEFVFLDNELLHWTIDRDGLQHAECIPADTVELAQNIRDFHRACSHGREIKPEGSAAALTKAFLEPGAPVLRTHQHLIVVPYGTAHLLPFQALYFDGEPLIATHTVRYLPSASMLQFLSARPLMQKLKMLAIGNPTGDLVNASIEAEFVASLFGEKPLIGAAATEEAVRPLLCQHTLLHFATHGKLNEDSPLASSILLANREELTVYELMGLRLDADLVVLSACNTGQGQATGGDDVLGLTRGLLGAGARAAVVSLWPVDDQSTSLLMGEFYRQLRAHARPAVALAEAQNYLRNLSEGDLKIELAKLRHVLPGAHVEGSEAPQSATLGRHVGEDEPTISAGYSRPYHWAAFILVGGSSDSEKAVRPIRD
jgi:CHAT domain-containing protein